MRFALSILVSWVVIGYFMIGRLNGFQSWVGLGLILCACIWVVSGTRWAARLTGFRFTRVNLPWLGLGALTFALVGAMLIIRDHAPLTLPVEPVAQSAPKAMEGMTWVTQPGQQPCVFRTDPKTGRFQA